MLGFATRWAWLHDRCGAIPKVAILVSALGQQIGEAALGKRGAQQRLEASQRHTGGSQRIECRRGQSGGSYPLEVRHNRVFAAH